MGGVRAKNASTPLPRVDRDGEGERERKSDTLLRGNFFYYHSCPMGGIIYVHEGYNPRKYNEACRVVTYPSNNLRPFYNTLPFLHTCTQMCMCLYTYQYTHTYSCAHLHIHLQHDFSYKDFTLIHPRTITLINSFMYNTYDTPVGQCLARSNPTNSLSSSPVLSSTCSSVGSSSPISLASSLSMSNIFSSSSSCASVSTRVACSYEWCPWSGCCVDSTSFFCAFNHGSSWCDSCKGTTEPDSSFYDPTSSLCSCSPSCQWRSSS